jgi:GT2 family glycosyltransferase
MLTLGVPTYRRYDLLGQLIGSAMAGIMPPDRYIIVDNGGKLGRPDWMPACAEIIVPGHNIGVGPAWNEMIRRSEDMLVICGDDVDLAPNTLSEMVRVAEEQDSDFVYPFPSFPNAQMFSCFLFRKRLVDKVGLFDESFYPAYFEDNDFYYRMRLAGVTQQTAPCAYGHINSGTMKAFNEDEMREHHARFEALQAHYVRKWGGMPHAERFTVPFNGKG